MCRLKNISYIFKPAPKSIKYFNVLILINIEKWLDFLFLLVFSEYAY